MFNKLNPIIDHIGQYTGSVLTLSSVPTVQILLYIIPVKLFSLPCSNHPEHNAIFLLFWTYSLFSVYGSQSFLSLLLFGNCVHTVRKTCWSWITVLHYFYYILLYKWLIYTFLSFAYQFLIFVFTVFNINPKKQLVSSVNKTADMVLLLPDPLLQLHYSKVLHSSTPWW